MTPTRVVLADDNQSFRGTLKAILALQPDIEIIGEAATGQETIRQVLALRPDVLVLDIRMPDYDGLEVLRRLRQAGDQTRVVVLSLWDNAEYRRIAKEQGASAYVVKGAAFTQLLPVIRGAT
ncbi:MAG: response regulator transcription factor [Anaerolineae bacterium]|jgi:DNA-binding NarL/FixJ family response regulator